MALGQRARVETKALDVWSLLLAAAIPSPMLLELGLDFLQDGAVCDMVSGGGGGGKTLLVGWLWSSV